MARVLVNKGRKTPTLPGNIMQTIELRDPVTKVLKGYWRKFRAKDGSVYWALYSRNSSTNVVCITPTRDLSSHLAGVKALKAIQKLTALIPPGKIK